MTMMAANTQTPSGSQTWRARLRADSAYLLLSWPMGVLAFVLIVTLVSLGISTVIIWIGVPILAFGLLTARGFATFERHLLERYQGRAAVTARYRTPAPDATGLRRYLVTLRDGQAWLDALWSVVHFVVSTLTWCLTVTWWAGAACVVLAPISAYVLHRALPNDQNSGLAELLGLPDLWYVDAGLQVAAALVFALTLPFVLRGLADAQAQLSHTMLNTRSVTQERIDALRSSRDAGREAEAVQLRRLERDIHDGPQQRLVRLGMDLARAERAAAADPEKAQQLIAEARTQTQETLAELRQLSRGIAPPVLVDRGLDAAVRELAARSSVPVTVGTALPGRLSAHVETAAYYVVSEALANANKHAGAQRAEVGLTVEGGTLVVTVIDDGVGGADAAKGHGLAGLAERLRAVDGLLVVDSPYGGPTTVRATLPTGERG